uniref:MSP domain-containing protein n=1 Tax=Lates calcarifer TaxID=8187 RepID=A0A4W6E5J8_LATCA
MTGEQRGGGRRGDRGQATGVASPLPVFLFPSELVFYSEQRNSHRRVLTLYNPYRFRIMLCTAPSLYRVVEAEGSVRAKSCVDLVVRHLDVSPRNWGRRDRFRMEVRGGGQVGEREIWAELRGGGEEGGGGGEQEEEERKRSKRGGGQQRAMSPLSPLLVPTQTHLQERLFISGFDQFIDCTGVCVLLMLPLHTETSSMVPGCLHVSTNQKLACAYTLGMKLVTVKFPVASVFISNMFDSSTFL